MVETTIRVEGKRGYPHGELFLLMRGADGWKHPRRFWMMDALTIDSVVAHDLTEGPW